MTKIVKELREAVNDENHDEFVIRVLNSKLNEQRYCYLLKSLLAKSEILEILPNQSNELIHLAGNKLTTKSNRELFLRQFCLELI